MLEEINNLVIVFETYEGFVFWLERSCLRGADFINEVKTEKGYTYWLGTPASRFFVVYKSKERVNYEFDVPQKPKMKIKVEPVPVDLIAMTTTQFVRFVNDEGWVRVNGKWCFK